MPHGPWVDARWGEGGWATEKKRTRNRRMLSRQHLCRRESRSWRIVGAALLWTRGRTARHTHRSVTTTWTRALGIPSLRTRRDVAVSHSLASSSESCLDVICLAFACAVRSIAFQRAPFAPAVSLLLMVLVPTAAPFCVYLLLLSTFHLNEYLLTAAFRPDTLNFDNFLLNHSRLYQAMILLSWLEYWLERLLAPGLKQWCPISSVGLCLSVLGLATRGIAMATASSNFSHLIEEVRATLGPAVPGLHQARAPRPEARV